MNRKIYSLFFIFQILLLLFSIEAKSQSTQMLVPPQVYCYSGGGITYGYWFQSPVNMWIVLAQNPPGCVSGTLTIEIYRNLYKINYQL